MRRCRIFRDDLGVNRLGLDTCEREGAIHFAYPIVILLGQLKSLA